MKWDIDQILEWTGGSLVQSGESSSWDQVTTDTRKSNGGQFFIPLLGPNFDAHDFIEQALDSGVTAFITHKDIENIPKNVTVIQVKDTLLALHKWARAYRQTLNLKVLAFTGTNGKTSTKEFLKTIVSPYRKCFSPEGSFNNHWGVPLSLLKLDSTHEMGLFELGMNHAGEIAELVDLVLPDAVHVTNVGAGHMEFFKSLEDVSLAKAEIYQASEAQVLFNLDNPWTLKHFEEYQESKIPLTYSENKKEADLCFYIKESHWDHFDIEARILDQNAVLKIPLVGSFHVGNLMAASGLALMGGLTPQEIFKSLPQVQAFWGRMQSYRVESGPQLLFDAYNSNPQSFHALLEHIEKHIKDLPGELHFVLGDMLELGKLSEDEHVKIFKRLEDLNLKSILYFGEYSGLLFSENKCNTKLYSDTEFNVSLANEFVQRVSDDALVIFKSSRGGRLERVLDIFLDRDEL